MDGEKAKAQRGMGRVHFLALLPAIREAIEQGWPMKSLFERHHNELQMSYPQFTRYVGVYITGKPPARRKDGRPDRRRVPPVSMSGGIKGFVYNPVPCKEDLI